MRRHVRLRGRLIQRRSGQRIGAAAGAEAEQGIERVATAATASARTEFRYEGLGATTDVESEVAPTAGRLT